MRLLDWLVMTRLVDWLVRPLEKLQGLRMQVMLRKYFGLSDAEAKSMYD